MDIKPIRTPEDHEHALEQIDRLWKAEPGTAEGDALEVLSTLVEAYEREHFPIPAPDPIAAIEFRIEQAGLSKQDLLKVFKTRARLSEVLNKKRKLNLNMIRVLNKRFSIPLDALVKDYKTRARGTKTTVRGRKASSQSR